MALTAIWPQPLDPLHSSVLSATVAALPLMLILVLMGGLRKSGLLASACGLGAAGVLAMLVWHMPFALLLWSRAYGFIYALWPVLWIVFSGLWLLNLTQDTGKFELLRCWMEEHASGDTCIQAILVAFCFNDRDEIITGGRFGHHVNLSFRLNLLVTFNQTCHGSHGQYKLARKSTTVVVPGCPGILLSR